MATESANDLNMANTSSGFFFNLMVKAAAFLSNVINEVIQAIAAAIEWAEKIANDIRDWAENTVNDVKNFIEDLF